MPKGTRKKAPTLDRTITYGGKGSNVTMTKTVSSKLQAKKKKK